MLEFNDTLAELEAAANAANPAAAARKNAACNLAGNLFAEGGLPLAEAEAVHYLYWQRTGAWLQGLESDDLPKIFQIVCARIESRDTDDPTLNLWLNRLLTEGMRREGLRPAPPDWEQVEGQPVQESDEDWEDADGMQHPTTPGGRRFVNEALSQVLAK
jgi:hypothetical protein